MTDTPKASSSETNSEVDVSVIVPVYNCEKFIEEAIESVRSQSLARGSYEIIAVNDGSTDNSLSILNRLARDADDLRIYSIANSGSAAAPRNRGLDEASGRYVFFLDADDKFSPDALKRLIQTADDTGSGVILGKLGMFGVRRNSGQVPSKPFWKTQYEVDFIESKASSTLGAWKLFRHSIIKEHQIRFPLGYMIGEDQPFTMKAYLHSPHVSVLSDKVYYWLRGRGDGTNVTNIGQPPRRHLDRIMTLISTIVHNTEPGLRRDQLLRRPIVGAAGTLSVFGRKMLPAHGRAEREEMLAKYRAQIDPLWNPRIRKYGAPASQILVDLVVRNDLDEIENVSETLRTKGHVPVEFNPKNSQFAYIPAEGDPISDLHIAPRVHLERIRYSSNHIEISGEIGIEGAANPPDSAQLVFRHRKSEIETSVDLDVSRTHSGPYGTRSRFRIDVDVDVLVEAGLWDSFIDASWGSLTFRENFGNSRAKGLDSHPVLLGNPTIAATFFTHRNNFSVDIGPTATYSSYDLLPKPVGRFALGRNEITQLSGVHSDMTRAEVHSLHSGKVVVIRVIRHQDNSASVIVPRSIAKKGRYSIVLHDTNEQTYEVPPFKDPSDL